MYSIYATMPWRPQFPDELESKIEEVAEVAGYQSKSELVRDAARRKVEELNNNNNKDSVNKTCENLKQIALDRSRNQEERRSAVDRLGDLGEVAIEPLSEVAKDAKDSRSHNVNDANHPADGDDIRKRARNQIENLSGK